MLVRATPSVELYGFGTQRVAILWKIVRTDGVTHRYTDHDAILPYEGENYTPASAFDTSARREQSGAKAGGFDAFGAIDDASISDDDLRAGVFRDAVVTEIAVDWRFPYAGALFSQTWYLGQAEFDGYKWNTELLSPARRLESKLGDVFDRTCENDLYDARCGVLAASYTVTGTVGLVEDGDKSLVFYASGVGSFSDGYFAHGELSFTSGANAGLSRNVKAWRNADKRIELHNLLPYEIVPGDAFTMKAGCNKLYGTCKSKFSNGPNFRGFLWMPGQDRVLRAPQLEV